MAEATLGATHPYAASLRGNLGSRLYGMGDYEGAEVYFREAVRLLDERTDVAEEDTVAPLGNLARLLIDRGRFEAARPFAERAVEISGRHSPETDANRLGSEINLASIDLELGHPEAALAVYRRALALFEDSLGPDHQATARARTLVGTALARSGRPADAEAALRAARAVQGRGDTEPWRPDDTALGLARLLLDDGRLDQAESLLQEALDIRHRRLPEGHWHIAEIEAEIAAVATARGRPDPALGTPAYRTLADTLPADDFRLARARRWLGELP
jgi:tetratricopeptide (TPR) repeat protein